MRHQWTVRRPGAVVLDQPAPLQRTRGLRDADAPHAEHVGIDGEIDMARRCPAPAQHVAKYERDRLGHRQQLATFAAWQPFDEMF